MYYIQTTANTGYVYFQLPGSTDWTAWEIVYGIDARFEVLNSKAPMIEIDELPEAITDDLDFSRLRTHIREVYKLS